MLELSVKVININLPVNHAILQKCRPLYEYSWFIEQIKKYLSEGKNRDDAIISAMQDCEQNGILTDFIREHGSEARNMLFTEFNMEDALEVRYEEGFADGKARGEVKAIHAIRKKLEKDMSPEEISDMLELEISYIHRIKELCETYSEETDLQIAERYLSGAE